MAHYHQESFLADPKDADDTPTDVSPDARNMAEITFSCSGKVAHCVETDTVLAAAKGAAINT